MDQVKFFNDCLPQILLGPFLNTLSQILYYPHIIFNFNSPHRGLSLHKCKKKNCLHKIFANFQVKSPHYYGGTETMISIFVFLWNLQISKSVTSSYKLVHSGCYTYAYFYWIISTINMKFGQISVSMTNISNMFLAQCWRLETVPGTFLTLLKW